MNDDNRPVAVVTRPREESEKLAARLEAKGYAVHCEPMFKIAPFPATIPLLEAYRGLIFTSANGAREFARVSDDRARPAYAVGGRTGAVLRELGFTDVRIGPGDAESLARMIAGEGMAGAKLLHLSGTTVAKDMAELLKPASVAVDRAVLYTTLDATELSSRLVEALYACTISNVLLFSAHTAWLFGSLAEEKGLSEGFRSVTALCLSQAVAADAAALPWKQVRVAARPTLDSVVDLAAPGG